MKNKQQNKTVLYEEMGLPSNTFTKDDFELQQNPSYGTSHKVTMDTNPAYESCKWLQRTDNCVMLQFCYSLQTNYAYSYVAS